MHLRSTIYQYTIKQQQKMLSYNEPSLSFYTHIISNEILKCTNIICPAYSNPSYLEPTNNENDTYIQLGHED